MDRTSNSNPYFDRDFVIGIRVEMLSQNPFTQMQLQDIVSRLKSILQDYVIVDERSYSNATYIYIVHRSAIPLIEQKRKMLEQMTTQLLQQQTQMQIQTPQEASQ